jgi:hypothetical protein
MKARVIVEDLEVSPSAVLSEEHKVQTVTRLVWRNSGMNPATFWKVGAILDFPDSYELVQRFLAEPADEECRQRAEMNAQEYAEAQQAARRLKAGISPEDFALYDAGIITGYNPDGSNIPGPNWDQMPQDEDEDDDE